MYVIDWVFLKEIFSLWDRVSLREWTSMGKRVCGGNINGCNKCLME